MVYVLGVFIAFFLALLIFTKKGRNQADTILGIWMLVIGCHLFSYYTLESGLIYKYPIIIWFNFPMPFLHGPLLFLYTLALTNPTKVNLKKASLHFILPLFILIFSVPYLFYSFNEQIKIIKNNGAGLETQTYISGLILNISGIFYIFITYRLLNSHQKRILDQFSYQEKINLNWLKFLFYGMGILWIFIIIIENDKLIFTSSTVFVVFMGYFGIKQVGIFTNQIEHEKDVEADSEDIIQTLIIETVSEKKKYAKSGLNEDSAKDLHQRLSLIMATEKLYCEPILNLAELATHMNIHPNYLSQVINDLEGVNFYDYINTLRIEEFKRLVALPENKKYTFLALAYDCGFNSKSAFNRFFKKITDLSPSEYLKSIK